jgi:hypothetical protein
MKIENNIGVFTVSELDPETNETYIGEFRVKLILSPLETIAIDRDYRELIGAVNPFMANSEANNLAFALSQLKHRVISSPSFWKGESYDGGHLPKKVLYSILDMSLEVQDKFKKQREDEMEAIRQKLTEQVKKGQIRKKAENEEELTENE